MSAAAVYFGDKDCDYSYLYGCGRRMNFFEFSRDTNFIRIVEFSNLVKHVVKICKRKITISKYILENQKLLKSLKIAQNDNNAEPRKI